MHVKLQWKINNTIVYLSTTNLRIEHKYPAIFTRLFGLFVILFCKRPVWQVGNACVSCFKGEKKRNPYKTRQLNSKKLLRHFWCVALLSIITNYYSLFVFWLALRAGQNTAQLVKILGDTVPNWGLITLVYFVSFIWDVLFRRSMSLIQNIKGGRWRYWLWW